MVPWASLSEGSQTKCQYLMSQEWEFVALDRKRCTDVGSLVVEQFSFFGVFGGTESNVWKQQHSLWWLDMMCSFIMNQNKQSQGHFSTKTTTCFFQQLEKHLSKWHHQTSKDRFQTFKTVFKNTQQTWLWHLRDSFSSSLLFPDKIPPWISFFVTFYILFWL